jgi:hypothetical protein
VASLTILSNVPKNFICDSSLNAFDDGDVLLGSIIWTIHRPYVFKPQRFKGWFFPRPQVKPTLLGPVDRKNHPLKRCGLKT